MHTLHLPRHGERHTIKHLPTIPGLNSLDRVSMNNVLKECVNICILEHISWSDLRHYLCFWTVLNIYIFFPATLCSQVWCSVCSSGQCGHLSPLLHSWVGDTYIPLPSLSWMYSRRKWKVGVFSLRWRSLAVSNHKPIKLQLTNESQEFKKNKGRLCCTGTALLCAMLL